MVRFAMLLSVVSVGCVSSVPASFQQPEEASSVPLELSMSRGTCGAACPIYTVGVSQGVLSFAGERHVAVIEPVTEPIDPAVEAKLTALFERSAFGTWTSYTRRGLTDAATVTLSYQGRSVTHYLGDTTAPVELTELEDAVDALLGTDRWISGTGTDIL